MIDEKTIGRLIERAKSAAEKAYCPYSGYAVGAAALAMDGTVYDGCNVENASYSLTLCAERVALAKAVSAGADKFSALCVYSAGGRMPYPCGACRQFLAEFSQDADIIVTDGNDVVKTKLSAILPYSFK